MYLAIRDGIVYEAGYPSLEAGLEALQIGSIELEYGRDDTLPSITGEKGQRISVSGPAGVGEVRGQLANGGYSACALMMANQLNGDRQFEVDWAVRGCRLAAELGIPVVRIDTILKEHDRISLQDQINVVVGVLAEVLEKTPDLDIPMGMENHGPGNDPDLLFGILEAFSHPRVGMTLDTGNLYWYGLPLEEVYRHQQHFASWTVHTHIKNIGYPPQHRDERREMGWKYGEYVCPIEDGDIDHQRLTRLLAEAGYTGAMTIEDECLGKLAVADRPGVLARDRDHVNHCIAHATA